MYSLRSCLLIVVLAIGSLQVGICQEKPAGEEESAPTKTELTTQLRVNKEALFTQGSVDAATVMLFHELFREDPNARGVLLDALNQNENSQARMAVCTALIQARERKESIKNDQDFIEPLLEIFSSDIGAEAELAVKATHVFEYQQIRPYLEKVIKDSSKPFKARANAIHALKIRLDMRPTIRLIELIDELGQEDKKVSLEAKKALSELGIVVGGTPEARKQNIERIKRQGESEFLRAQLARQEIQVRLVKAELDEWQKRYLTQLDKTYKSISEDKLKADFLIEYLRDSQAVVRLWALDKAYKWRLVSQLPDPIGPELIKLISDKNRDIRLKTAELLALMQQLDSAQPLLDQHQVEQDDQVRTKLFIALGARCASAITGPPSEIPDAMKKIRSTTLELAGSQYLISTDDEKVRNAAEVIRKLLVKDSLKPEEVDKYLNLLSARYESEKDKPTGALRDVLLNAMASLCAPESSCKTKAQSLFKAKFKDALQDKTDFVRVAAVNGLAYISKKEALELLRAGFFNDPSEALRKKLIALVDEIGDEQDLSKLAEKIGMNSEGELAWQAMLSIFNRVKEGNVGVWKEWVGKITAPGGNFSNEQKIAFLKLAETKAPGPIKVEARKILGDLYYATGQFEQSADYFGRVYEAAQNTNDMNAIFPKLLDASLKGLQIERVAGLVGNHLSEGDLDPEGVIIKLLTVYLGKPPLGTNQKAVLKALEEIKVPQKRPKWQQWLNGWKTTPNQGDAGKEEKPQEAKK